MTFRKVEEDFTCEHCGHHVEGSGYTNHCPKCLWSKHVDNEPGDRAARCGALMESVRVEGASPDYVLVHRCTACGVEKRNKVSPHDDVEVVVAIAKRQ